MAYIPIILCYTNTHRRNKASSGHKTASRAYPMGCPETGSKNVSNPYTTRQTRTMQTEYRQTTLGSMQPHRATVRTQLAVDPGNRFTKWIDCQTVRSIPSYVKELADWEEGGSDANAHTYLIYTHSRVLNPNSFF
jgi:hypothetical protein